MGTARTSDRRSDGSGTSSGSTFPNSTKSTPTRLSDTAGGSHRLPLSCWISPLYAAAFSLRARVWFVLAVAAIANLGLAYQVLDLQDRLEQRPHQQRPSGQLQPATMPTRPAGTDAGMTRASLGTGCQTCVSEADPQLPWTVMLGVASMLLAVAMAATLTLKIRTRSTSSRPTSPASIG